MSATKSKSTAYDVITDRVLALLDAGTVPWHCPWTVKTALPRSLTSNANYRGVNVFLLWALGYEQPYFVTYRKAQEWGGHVKKGERGCPVVFWKWFEKEDKETGEVAKLPCLRYYTVFNVDQCEGLDERYQPIEQPTHEHDPIEAAERLIAQSSVQVSITHGNRKAGYQPAVDAIFLPHPERFETREAYYSTVFHELIHATGHQSRLARKSITDGAAFASHEYSKEELIAEMGAAFLCAECGIVDHTIQSTASYIDNWRRVISRDPKLVVTAAAAAQKAVDLILGRTWDDDEATDSQRVEKRTPAIEPEPVFALRNEARCERPLALASSDRTRQGVLFTGMDCLPGQADLFGDLD